MITKPLRAALERLLKDWEAERLAHVADCSNRSTYPARCESYGQAMKLAQCIKDVKGILETSQ